MEMEDVKKLKKGDILHDQWGYDMLINEYCVIQKNTGKTIKCQMVEKHKIPGTGDAMTYKVTPNETKPFCTPFNIRVSKSRPNINDPEGKRVWLVGSHPYTKKCEYKRRGSWDKWDGQPDTEDHAD